MWRTGILALLGLLVTIAPDARATTQIRDRLQCGHSMHEVLGTSIPRELLHQPDEFAFQTLCSACGRGFVGEWTIRDGMLCLVSVKDWQGKSLSAKADKWVARGPAQAWWFSGTIYSPKLRVLWLPGSPAGGVYFGYRAFDFHRGKLLGTALEIEPVGASLLLIEVTLLWLATRWVLGRRRRNLQRIAERTAAPADLPRSG